ncbi:MAG TPA: RIO1 family regulatory kinase/ATPase [Ignavibacteria bacterium]|nr:RIO1 family regulatory kinase/ATPase [Ignavibacteria bacterium]
MKITLNNLLKLSEEDYSFQKFSSRKKKFAVNKRVNGLMTNEGQNYSFETSDLEELRGKAVVDELMFIIKSGKEATVYLAKSADGYSAVKIYTELRVRSFKNDGIYRQGRFIGNARIEKAINQGSKTGINAHQILWVNEEFRQMKFLYEAGIPVPRPIASSGLVVVMEFIGEDEEAAPRISDLTFEKDEAREAFSQSLGILEKIISTGRIHGDYSAYNLLWNKGKAVVIDFPQVINFNNNISAKDLLRRDVSSLYRSFKKYRFRDLPDEERIYNKFLRIITETKLY